MQTQADLLGLPVLRPAMAEVTAFGAAALAGLGLGLGGGLGAHAERMLGTSDRFDPQIDTHSRERRRAEWARAVKRARGWANG